MGHETPFEVVEDAGHDGFVEWIEKINKQPFRRKDIIHGILQQYLDMFSFLGLTVIAPDIVLRDTMKVFGEFNANNLLEGKFGGHKESHSFSRTNIEKGEVLVVNR